MGEAVENDRVFQAELARLVRDPEDDDRGCFDVAQRQRIHEAGIGVIVMRRDRHAPPICGRDATFGEYTLEPRAVLRGDALRHPVHLRREMGKADRIGETSQSSPRRRPGPTLGFETWIPASAGLTTHRLNVCPGSAPSAPYRRE